ncbi:MAG: DNA ligase D [Chloroflexi bacterium]|nr:DNA ligase D [Chloroflexota bacterium]
MLDKYSEKRDFERTPEPASGDDSVGTGPLTFVIQKHDATRLHYDFRLEIDGVLKSWPIPKGPSLDPSDKRLAVMVEDHPMDYATFEGVIPKGEYGAGEVIVWDAGTYSPDDHGRLSFHDRGEASQRMREALENGKLSVFLRGQKLKGSWTLVKTSRGENEWLLIKHKDRFVDTRDVTEEEHSVLSQLSLDDIRAGHLPQRRSRLGVKPQELTGAKKARIPKSVKPMLATLTDKPFSSDAWLFEPKLDGVRVVAFLDGNSVRLQSRRGLDATNNYPLVAEDLKSQTEPQLVLDGEIVAHDEDGVPSFQLLQQRINLQREADIQRADSEIPVLFYVFDLLYAGGYDLRSVPLIQRKSLLSQIVIPSDCVQIVDHFEEDGNSAYKAVVEHGLEGLIAKKVDSLYESGKRASGWLKIKSTLEDEFVVGGYSQGQGGRAGTFGALLVGQYDKEGKLTYAGKVGTGFDDRTLEALKSQLDDLMAAVSPFAEDAKPGSSPFGRPKNTAVTWVQPELVARVKFSQWTDDNRLRAPSFLGLREDKDPKEVQRARVVAAPVAAVSTPPARARRKDAAGVLSQLEQGLDEFTLKVGRHKVPVTNLSKELWPAMTNQRALTKRDLLVYLARVSPYLLPHLKDRPLTLTRYPNGITEKHFYQKHWEGKLPAFVDTVALYSSHNEGDGDYLMCNNLPTLLWLGQLADIELHTWYSRTDPEPDGHHLPTAFSHSDAAIRSSLLNYPDFIVFDLDPYIYSGEEAKGEEPELNRRAFAKTCEVALWLKEILDSLSLSSFVKTTGRTGLHIYVPILRQLDYGAVRSACETIGKFLVRAHPRDITMEWAVNKRTGKVFFDHNQNVRGKTLASLYSPRPSANGGVSMPIHWDEVGEVYPTDFTILTAPARLEQTGDLWADILKEKHDLEKLLGSIESED